MKKLIVCLEAAHKKKYHNKERILKDFIDDKDFQTTEGTFTWYKNRTDLIRDKVEQIQVWYLQNRFVTINVNTAEITQSN